MAPRFDDAPWRRMAMQAVLAAALGLTVLMAYGVQRRQFSAQQVQLSPPAVYSFMGHRLSVRLPSGWTVVRRRDPEAQQAMVEAIETTSPFGIHRRLQLVVQFDAGETTAEEASVKYHEGHSASIVRPYQFAGSPGVWMEFPLEAADPSSGRDWQPPEVCVSAVPKNQHGAILLNFGGMQTLTTTDIALFEQVAATVSLVDGSDATTTTTTEPVDRPRLRELQPSERSPEND